MTTHTLGIAASVEFTKQRRGFGWFPIAGAVAAALLVASGWWSYARFAETFQAQQIAWVAIWGNTALLFGGFAMPILLCLHMAWSMRMEQLNGNIARLRAAGLLGRSLIAGKLAGALRASLILSAELWLLYTLAGLSHGFRPDAEYARTLGYLLLGLLGGWSTGCVLLLVACLIRSFAVLMGVSVLAAMSGFAVVFAAPQAQWLWPFCQASLGMHARDPLTLEPLPTVLFVVTNAVIVLAAAGLSGWLLGRRED